LKDYFSESLKITLNIQQKQNGALVNAPLGSRRKSMLRFNLSTRNHKKIGAVEALNVLICDK
jgi:hypothetical protein